MMEKITGRKGIIPIIGLFGILVLVIAPIVVAYAMASIMPGLPIILYVVIGYAMIWLIDIVVLTALLKLPAPIAMAISMVLPFLQQGIALFAV